jgi:hypothetical protein
MTRRALAVVAALALGAMGGCYDDGEPRPGACDVADAVSVPNEGWKHVSTDEELVYAHNPPSSGPHFSVWASYAIHDQVISRGNWVHNLEHGAIVLLTGPSATDAQRQLMRDAWEAIPLDPDCGHRRALLTADPLLDEPLAAVAADAVLAGPALAIEQIVAFAEACRDRAPEDVCF